MQQNVDIRSSKNSRLQQTIEAAVRDPKKLLRDPLWRRDPPVGNHCSRGLHSQNLIGRSYSKTRERLLIFIIWKF